MIGSLEHLEEAKTKRQQEIERLQVCTCAYPVVRVRNMVGHPDSCPAYAVWKRQHNPPEVGARDV